MPDGSIFKGKKRETDQKISEIIGLDADQFTQISMIAQGEFLKLLLAESRERKKIFSRIFQTRFYYRIQEELKKQAVQLYVKLEQNLQEMKLEMARVEYPSYKKDGGVCPEEVQLEKCTEENELIKQWKVIAGQDIPDRERISVILKEIIDQGNRWEKVCKKEGLGPVTSLSLQSPSLPCGRRSNALLRRRRGGTPAFCFLPRFPFCFLFPLQTL